MDLISRQAVFKGISLSCTGQSDVIKAEAALVRYVEKIPSAEPTLYGYKIEHLAYIARVMEKEGVTADYAVRTFDDMSRALRMIIEEAQERVMETLNERYDRQTGGD